MGAGWSNSKRATRRVGEPTKRPPRKSIPKSPSISGNRLPPARLHPARARVRAGIRDFRGRSTMTQRPLAVVVLAAGKGTRMRSALPKVLHKVAGRSMVGHVIAVAEDLGADRVVVVVAPGMDDVAAAVKP